MKTEEIKAEFEEKESSYGAVTKISRQLIEAQNIPGVKIRELVHIGSKKILGEVLKIQGDNAFIQCYDHPTQINIGDLVLPTKNTLAVFLGPGILDQMTDGILRPFKPNEVFLPSYQSDTSSVPKPDKTWLFSPSKWLKIGSVLTAGDVLGTVYETSLMKEHKIMVPPKFQGRLTSLTPEGNYYVDEPIVELENEQKIHIIRLYHPWPIRNPRPFLDRLAGKNRLITGYRVVDGLFPMRMGETCTIPGGFGGGKNTLLYMISKNSCSDVLVRVYCGERGVELAESLLGYPELQIKNGDQFESIMGKSCLVGNSVDMPILAQEASIYTGMTIAEYFRDMGYNSTLLVDSMSRWAKALGEISNSLNEIPSEGNYPSYLNSRLSQFCERAGRVRCLGNPGREGSVTLVATVSPEGGNFFDPVTRAALDVTNAFWALDTDLARRRIFPNINVLRSRSSDDFFVNAEYEDLKDLRGKFLRLIQAGEEINETVKIIGKEALSAEERLDFEMAGMMRCITMFYDLARVDIQKAHTKWTDLEGKVKENLKILSLMKFEDWRNSKKFFDDEYFPKIMKNLIQTFSNSD